MTRKRQNAQRIPRQGIAVQELCRKQGISDATFYKWLQYARLKVSDVKKVPPSDIRVAIKAHLLLPYIF